MPLGGEWLIFMRGMTENSVMRVYEEINFERVQKGGICQGQGGGLYQDVPQTRGRVRLS
jgi:hypothetical protein